MRQPQRFTLFIDRTAKITISKGMDVNLDSFLTEKVVAIQGEPLEPNDPVEPVEPVDPDEPAASLSTTLEVAVPMEGQSGITLRNLINLLYDKQVLVKRSLGIESNNIEDEFAKAINDANVDTLENFKASIS